MITEFSKVEVHGDINKCSLHEVMRVKSEQSGAKKEE